MTEEELEKTQEEVTKEVEGKSESELEQMAQETRQELEYRMYADACTYLWNLMGMEGPFDQEKYNAFVENRTKEVTEGTLTPFTRLSDNDFLLNQYVFMQGYGNWGKEFVETILAKDPESAKVVLEAAVQAYLELRMSYEQLLSVMENAQNQVFGQKEEVKNNEEEK